MSLAEAILCAAEPVSDKTASRSRCRGRDDHQFGGFWIKNDASGARFVNYDTPGLEIARDGETISVGENEGVVLTGAGAQRAQVLQARS